jgi:4a-hydroxytetrahydrobiopterin dehydratase
MRRREIRRVGQLLVRQAALGTQQVERPVRDDAVQPRPERATVVEASECRERPLEPVGGHVVRERAAPGDRVRSAPGVAPVTAEEHGRSFPVAAARPPDEVSVTRLTHFLCSLVRARRLCASRRGNTPVVDGWGEQDDALVREFELPSFPAAIEFVDRLAELAESEDHHPDIDIRYRRVTVRWTTHSAGGITEKDREMAERTSALAAA